MRPSSSPGLLLICFALPEEARFFTPPAVVADRVRVLVTGMGIHNAAVRVNESFLDGCPELVLTCGFAGALKSDIPLGAVLYSEDEGAGLGPWLSELGARPARFHCSPRIVATASEKKTLREKTGADAVEMESEAIREICRKRSIASATIRVISDLAEEDFPLDFNTLLTERLEMSYRKLAWALLRSPGRIPRLLRLQKQTQSAARHLAWVLQELLLRKCGRAG